MKTFEAFNTIDEFEEQFLQLAHLDELEIKFDFIKYEDNIFYHYNDNCLFDQNKKNKNFYINYDKIWSVFEIKFNLNYNEIKEFMSSMIEKHFKLKDYTTMILFIDTIR